MSLKSRLSSFVIRRPRLRQFLTRLIYGDRDMTVQLFGTGLSINSVKENGYLRAAQILETAHSLHITSELPVILNLALLIQDGDTFVDVGANVGLYACAIGRRRLMGPRGNRIYAYEPNPDTFARLKKTDDLLGIQCINKAVSDRPGKMEFVGAAVSNIFTATQHATEKNLIQDRVVLDCCRLDEEAIEGNRILLKIDVEGHEMSALRGAEKLFDAGRIFAVYLDGFDDPDILPFLRSKGMIFYDGRTLEPINENRYNFLAIRDEERN